MPEPTYRVKRLVWEETLLENFVAPSLFGDVWIEAALNGEWFVCLPGAGVRSPFDDAEAAKLAAESWYRARLLEALEPVEERT